MTSYFVSNILYCSRVEVFDTMTKNSRRRRNKKGKEKSSLLYILGFLLPAYLSLWPEKVARFTLTKLYYVYIGASRSGSACNMILQGVLLP